MRFSEDFVRRRPWFIAVFILAFVAAVIVNLTFHNRWVTLAPVILMLGYGAILQRSDEKEADRLDKSKP